MVAGFGKEDAAGEVVPAAVYSLLGGKAIGALPIFALQ
jgi:hypothetical protein